MNYKLKNYTILVSYTFLAHLVITIMTLTSIYICDSMNILNNSSSILVFIIVLGLYFYSGYLITNQRNSWYQYFGIAFIGIIIWIVAFLHSPDSLNYKSNPQAEFWMIYRFYIMGIESPINYLDFNRLNASIRLSMVLIVFFPVLASILQYLGGLLKIRKINMQRMV